MKSQSQKPENFIYDRLLASMTESEKASFTEPQLSLLYKAAKKLAPRKHAINIRMSIPIPYRPGVYFVLLGGQERRNMDRIRWERQMFWRFSAICLGVLTLVASVLLGSPIMDRLGSISSQVSAPTALPWIEDKQECKEFGLVWDDGACWDAQHDSTF